MQRVLPARGRQVSQALFAPGATAQAVATTVRLLPVWQVRSAVQPVVAVMRHERLASVFTQRHTFIRAYEGLAGTVRETPVAQDYRAQLASALGEIYDHQGLWTALRRQAHNVAHGHAINVAQFDGDLHNALEANHRRAQSHYTQIDYDESQFTDYPHTVGVTGRLLEQTHELASEVYTLQAERYYASAVQDCTVNDYPLLLDNNSLSFMVPVQCGLYRVLGAQWSYPDIFAQYFPSHDSAVVPLLPLRLAGEAMTDDQLAQLGLERIIHGGAHVQMPLLMGHSMAGPGVVGSRRVGHIVGSGRLPIVRSGIGLRVLTSQESYRKHAAAGSLDTLPFKSLRMKGVGVRYYGRPNTTTRRRVQDEVIHEGSSQSYSLIGPRSWLGRYGIFLDEGHQDHSQIPYGAGASDDVRAIMYDRQLLHTGAIMSVINLDAVPLVSRAQLPGLTNEQTYVTRGVLLDTSATLESVISSPARYQRWVESYYGADVVNAREQHLRELAFNLGRNMHASLLSGFRVNPQSSPTQKDLSAVGGMKDTGELLFWDGSERNRIPTVIMFFMHDLADMFVAADVPVQQLIAGPYFHDLIRGMLPLGFRADQVPVLQEQMMSEVSEQSDYTDVVRLVAHELDRQWFAMMGRGLARQGIIATPARDNVVRFIVDRTIGWLGGGEG